LTPIEVLMLSEKETEQVGLDWPEAIAIIEKVFREHGLGGVVVPTKVNVDTNIAGDFLSGGNAMPSFIEHLNIYGIKWITWNWANPKQGLPSVMATITLNDPATGAPVAIMGGAWITAMRTGAVSAVAFKYLGNKNSETLAVIGAGTQGRFQISAMNEVKKFKQIRLYDVRADARESLARDTSQKLGVDVKPVSSVKEAVEAADVVITVTTANEPLVKARWLKEKGVLLCSLGSYQEFDFASIKKANKIVVDHTEQTLHRGELGKWVQKDMLGPRDIYAELSEIVSGKKPGRTSEDENIFCVPIGMSCDDIALAHRIWQKAKSKDNNRIIRWL